MPDNEGQGQGSGQAQGAEEQQQQKGDDEFDKDRALATIKTQRESEAAAKAELKAAKASLAELQGKVKEFEDGKLSGEQKTAKQIADLETQLADQTTKAQARAVRASLTAAGAKSGAINPDDIYRLVELSEIEFNADGEPTNAGQLVEDLKKDRPHLFGKAGPGSFDGGRQGAAPAKGSSMEDLLRGAANAPAFTGERKT